MDENEMGQMDKWSDGLSEGGKWKREWVRLAPL